MEGCEGRKGSDEAHRVGIFRGFVPQLELVEHKQAELLLTQLYPWHCTTFQFCQPAEPARFDVPS